MTTLTRQTTSLLLLAACTALTGCATVQRRCRLAAGNATAQHLSFVTIEQEDLPPYSFTNIAPHQVSSYTGARSAISGVVAIQGKWKDGKSFSGSVTIETPIPQKMAGRVIFQVEKDSSVRMFVMPDRRQSNAGVLPWAVPPLWQNTISVPGMSGDE